MSRDSSVDSYNSDKNRDSPRHQFLSQNVLLGGLSTCQKRLLKLELEGDVPGTLKVWARPTSQ